MALLSVPAVCFLHMVACASTPLNPRVPPEASKTEESSEAGSQSKPRTTDPGNKSEETPKASDDTRPDAKGRPVRTSFYGAELVREKVVVDGVPVTRISIRGGAVLRHNDVMIYAPRIELDGATKGRCVGGVRIVDTKNGLTIRAGRADYDRDQQTLALHEDPVMTQRREKDAAPLVITATRMVRLMGERKSTFESDVRILQKPWTLIGDTGVYFDESQRLDLPGAPVLLGPDGFMTAGTLSYFVSDRLVRLETQVVLLSRSESALPGAAEKSRTPSLEQFSRTGGQIAVTTGDSATVPRRDAKDEANRPASLSGDRLEYRFPKEGPATMQVDGNVWLLQRDTQLRTKHMRAEGKDFQMIVADRSVRMLERRNNIRVNAGRMVYDRAAGLLRLDQEPRMEFLKKGTTEATAELTAQIIERDVKADRTTARGDVRILRGTTEATGAHADYDRKADVIVLDGAPHLVRGRSRIACEQILIFPGRNRVLMKNRITGTLLE